MSEKLTITRSDGCQLTLDLVAETLQGGNLVVVQVEPELKEMLNEIAMQPMKFEFFEEGQDVYAEFTGKVLRLTQHTYNQGRPQLQVEIQSD